MEEIIETETEEKVLLVKIDSESMKKLKLMGLHYDLKQKDIVEKLINERWDNMKFELTEE